MLSAKIDQIVLWSVDMQLELYEKIHFYFELLKTVDLICSEYRIIFYFIPDSSLLFKFLFIENHSSYLFMFRIWEVIPMFIDLSEDR